MRKVRTFVVQQSDVNHVIGRNDTICSECSYLWRISLLICITCSCFPAYLRYFARYAHEKTPPPVKRSSRLSKKADRTRGSPNVYHRLTDTASPHPTPIEPLANRTNYIPILETQQHEKEVLTFSPGSETSVTWQATQSLQQGTEEVLKLLRICGKAIQHSRRFIRSNS